MVQPTETFMNVSDVKMQTRWRFYRFFFHGSLRVSREFEFSCLLNDEFVIAAREEPHMFLNHTSVLTL